MPSPEHARVLLAAESLRLKASGIGRVARLMARVLEERTLEGSLTRLRAVTLNDRREEAIRPWVRPCGGRRLPFVLRVQREAMLSNAVFYDSLSMARAHAPGPARGRKSLVWMHGIEVWEGAREVHLGAARRAGLLLTNSAYTRARAASLHTELARARVCWLGTEADDPPETLALPHPPTVLILSRLDRGSYKGHRELFAAWPAIRERIPDARLLVVGDGPGRDELERLARAHAPPEAIVFAGFVPADEHPELWAEADLLAMPSRGEGFGLVYIEAMRHALPVIASRQDAGQEINVDGVTGFNIDLTDPRALVDALLALLGNPGRAREMGRAGRERWKRHFTRSAFRRRFEAILEEEGLLPRREDPKKG